MYVFSVTKIGVISHSHQVKVHEYLITICTEQIIKKAITYVCFFSDKNWCDQSYHQVKVKSFNCLC